MEAKPDPGIFAPLPFPGDEIHSKPPSRTSLKRGPGLIMAIVILTGAGITVAGNSARAGTTNTVAVSTVTASNMAATYPDFRLRPFQAATVKGAFQWTSEDGKNTNIIRQLAHNDREYRRMALENATIYRRQLVYIGASFAALAQNAAQTRQGIKQIQLPGLDGQVFTVEVARADIRNDGNRGQIYGHLEDQPDSMVTVAFLKNREAFTIISPKDGVYLQAESREPGEVIIKSVNPKTYGAPGY